MEPKHKFRHLTKTLFVTAMSCPTKMYYRKNLGYQSSKDENEFYQYLKDGGFQFEELVRLYYPKGHYINFKDHQQAILQTSELLQQENVTIYEATIVYDTFLIRIDILQKNKKRLELIEIKSKSLVAGKESLTTANGYIDSKWRSVLYDIAFQTYVVQHAFPDHDVIPYLVAVDTSKQTTVDGLNQKFKIKQDKDNKTYIQVIPENLNKDDVGEEILVKIPVLDLVQQVWDGAEKKPGAKYDEDQRTFIDRAKDYAGYYQRNEKYPVTIGSKCKNCEYRIPKDQQLANMKNGFEECWREALYWSDNDFEKPHIFDLWNFRQVDKLLDQKIYFLEDLGSKVTDLNDRQQLQVSYALSTTNDLPVEDINPELFDIMKQWTFPFHFIDFETTSVALPFNKGLRPYEQYAYQFSIHTVEANGQVRHTAEWINVKAGVFPNYQFIRELRQQLSKDEGTIFVYSKHENMILNAIYNQLDRDKNHIYDADELMVWIRTITEWKEDGSKQTGPRNMVDLLELVRKYYYHSMMQGSNSLKVVLRSIVQTSSFLKQKYSQPYTGTNFTSGIQLWQQDAVSKQVIDPYTLLKTHDEQVVEIKDGISAMVAYGRLQFTDLDKNQREQIEEGLKRYCELDTLAMVMLYEHWHSLS